MHEAKRKIEQIPTAKDPPGKKSFIGNRKEERRKLNHIFIDEKLVPKTFTTTANT